MEKENKTEQYNDRLRNVLKKLKEIKTEQDEMLVLISQASITEIDEIEDSSLTLGVHIDEMLSKLWVLKTNTP